MPGSSETPIEPLLIVGIGASAGGLEAFKGFFSAMPADSGMAFVLVQHLAPDHPSLLPELVGRNTTLPVSTAADGELVQADHVYVIPPDATLTISEGTLRVSRPAPPRQHRWPINALFASLAEDQGDCAVCIVLSGTGSDGALGLRAVKEHGGLTLAQAGFDHVAMSGMPASAAATGLVDDVLPVEEMPARLLAHRKHLKVTAAHKGADGTREDLGEHLRTICALLRAEVGHDFSQYKQKTLARRVQRRMHVVETETVPDYIAYLRKHPDEHRRLFRELLIGVTEFFRDPQAFEALQATALPSLLAGRNAADVLRIWVAGCATGEEAYSIAIALQEAMDGNDSRPKVQIFATDIDDHAIGAARAGRYRAPLVGISPERQERWFTQDGDDWCVAKQIRDMCVFSTHSAIKDPPFSRMDLVSCRNLMIYLNPEAQEHLVRTFHYALRPGGYLLLGTSESIARNTGLFSAVSKSQRLYLRRDDGRGLPLSPPVRDASRPGPGDHAAAASAARPDTDTMESAARRAMEKHSPAYVVIDDNHEVLRFVGDTGRYLGPASGAASLDLFTLLHKGLRTPVRAAVREALAGERPVARETVATLADGRQEALRVVVEPLATPGGRRRLYVVAFAQPVSAPAASSTTAREPPHTGPADLSATHALEQDLENTRFELLAALEQQELANEELKSANEEYQSVNEELQSANEELETAKEEMQSINEELQTVNSELHGKNDMLSRLNSDLRNLQESTQIATLFLDSQLRIRGFTPAATDVFHLREGDRGRPITDIAAQVSYPELGNDAIQVLRNLAVTERTLHSDSTGQTFMLRMRPYRTIDNVIDGVVLTFVDITERHRQESELGLLAAIVDSSKDAIIGHTREGTITSWNASAERILGYQASRVVGRSLDLLVPPATGTTVGDLLTACTERPRSQEMEMPWVRLDGSIVQMSVTCSPVIDRRGEVVAGSLIARDITERNDAAQHVQIVLGELDERARSVLEEVKSTLLHALAHAPDLASFRDSFLPRLQVIANTRALLVRNAWRGVDLKALVLAETAPHARERASRVHLKGGTVLLTPNVALALGMALHELAGNARRFGAFSVPEGRVGVQWKTRERKGTTWVQLLWVESGGPPVVPPRRRGFGSSLLEQALASELDGEVRLAFNPDGVTCHIDVPLPTP